MFHLRPSTARRTAFLAATVALAVQACGGPEPTGPPGGSPSAVLRDTAIFDATYCTAGDAELRADLWFPAGEVGPSAPAALFVHGGGWTSGSKSGGVALAMLREPLLRAGFVVASVDYRLAPDHPWPAQIEDVKCAVRYLRASADSFGVDEGRVAVWGPSAGGHLAAMLGTTDASSGFGDGGDHRDESSRVQAVVDLYGPADLTAEGFIEDQQFTIETVFGTTDPDAGVLREASPVTHASPGDAPFLIMHGREDNVVPVGQSRALHDRLQGEGVPSTLIVVDDAGHGFVPVRGTPSPSRDELVSRALDFLRARLGP